MINKLIFTLIIVSSLISCNLTEDKWKKPSDLYFDFQIKNSNISLLKINNCQLSINQIIFKGKRNQGLSDIELIQKYDIPAKINCSSIKSSSGLMFNVPQGEYSTINVLIETKNDNTSSPIIINANLNTDTTSDSTQVVIEIQDDIVFDILSSNSTHTNTINFIEGKSYQPTIVFDFDNWIKEITYNQLNNANYTQIKNEYGKDINIILINKLNNKNIYDLIIKNIRFQNIAIF